ncbi:VPS10 domain-containing protein [Candidatus Palauibacter sp.]|uniref:VPS10 domain-containing protein n=1 Tax=Candidatus Palauibacter sp. TaxID=3101350 RepID=UPI003B02940E
MIRVRRFFATLLLVAAADTPLSGQHLTPEQYEGLQARHIGPVGFRVSSVAGVPGDPSTYFAGAATGGIWKTDDAGLHWRPVFDDQPVHSIGALAVAPSDHAVVWAGTGETSIRSNVSIGNGVWKSTDGGESWTHMGLEGTGRVGRILIHPTDADIVYVAALGHAYAESDERGVYRTADGGASWEKILFVDRGTGAYDMVMDPANPRKIFATMWDIDLKTWKRDSGGPGSGLHLTMDGGGTWTELEGNGLPTGTLGKIAVCMSHSDSDRVYALIETSDGVPMEGYETDTGELWRSDDGGGRWRLVNHSHDLATRQAYYTRCGVSSDDPDEVYFLSSSFAVSRDGGENYTLYHFLRGPYGRQPASPGYDHHDIWVDPEDARRVIIGGDMGVHITENGMASWFRVQLPVAQSYHVTVDNAIPYNVMGNLQDGPSVHGPSNTRYQGFWTTGIIPRGDWISVGGGESGFATPDPTNPDVIWSTASGSGARGGIVTRHELSRGQFRDVEVWPESTGGYPAEALRYRFQWTFPLLISPHDNETIYVTSQHVHRTRNRGQSWEVISPDLSTNDRERMTISGGLTPDNIGVEYCCVIYAFDESPLDQGVFWAGTNDGLVHVSRDDGATWTNVTANIPDLPPDGVVRSIDASRYDVARAYITIEHHQVGDFEARAYRTDDFGETWTRITDGVDNHPVDYTRHLLEDPVRPGLLYLGTESSLYLSYDDGESWQRFMPNLPPTPYYGLVVQEHFNDLVAGTYGRGYWILDDLSGIQQLTPEIAASDAHLFQPRDAYRFNPTAEPMIMFADPSAGENPPNGASINYWLGGGQGREVRIRVESAAGETLATLDGSSHEGFNRVWWDFRGPGPKPILFRTKPLHAEWFPLPEVARPSGGPGSAGPREPPGAYTVVLVVDGEEAGRRSLTVLRDPNSAGTLDDILAQRELLDEIIADRNRVADLVNRMESLRRQIHDLRPVLEEAGDAEDVLEAGEALDAALIEVESELVQLKNTGPDGARWPSMIAGRLSYLQGAVATADFPPTDQHAEVARLLSDRIDEVEVRLQTVLAGELAEFNRMLQARVGRVITTDQGIRRSGGRGSRPSSGSRRCS